MSELLKMVSLTRAIGVRTISSSERKKIIYNEIIELVEPVNRQRLTTMSAIQYNCIIIIIIIIVVIIIERWKNKNK